jgi:hypothetical protein
VNLKNAIRKAGDGGIPDPVSQGNLRRKSKGNAEVNATFKGDGNVCKSDPE